MPNMINFYTYLGSMPSKGGDRLIDFKRESIGWQSLSLIVHTTILELHRTVATSIHAVLFEGEALR